MRYRELASDERFEVNAYRVEHGGQSLATVAITPRGEKPRGTILQFHGNAQNLTSHIGYLFPLLEDGFRIVAFDYRGYGASTGSPERSGMVADGAALIRDSCRRYGESGVIIVGQSLGGALAPVSLSRGKHCAKGLILDSAFASYRGIARKKVPWPLTLLVPLLISDGEDAIAVIGGLSVPILIGHAEDDPVVPFTEGLALKDQAPAAMTTWVPYPGATHTTLLRPEHPPYQRVQLFLNRLAPRNPSPS